MSTEPISLQECRKTRPIRGVPFPEGVRYRQIVITGPPGCGKSTLTSKIGGWPNEGYLDLTQNNWWRSRDLSFRPREVHLGFPFDGFPEALALFDDEWIKSAKPLELDLHRIQIPPPPSTWIPWNWRKKYAFFFLLPPPDKVFQALEERALRQSHPGDRLVTLEKVQEQAQIFHRIAVHFHRHGLIVFVWDDYQGRPKRFVDKKDEGADNESDKAKSRSMLHHVFKRLANRQYECIEDLDRLHLAGEGVSIHRGQLPIGLTIGKQKINVYPETPIQPFAEFPKDNLLLVDPDDYFSKIGGFVRLSQGDRVRIGEGAEDSLIGARMPENALPRAEIAHDGDCLQVVDLESPSGTTVTTLKQDRKNDAINQMCRENLMKLSRYLGGSPSIEEPDRAQKRLRQVIEILQKGHYREKNSDGAPGGLVQLPEDVTPIIVGDLHTKIDNLLKILCENHFLESLENGLGCLVLLGDIVHQEEQTSLGEMASSVLIMDVIFQLIRTFPKSVVFVRGNHDSFSADVTKEGVPQGVLWHQELKRMRGKKYQSLFQKMYDLLPFVVVSNDFVACHAGPPTSSCNRKQLIDVQRYSRLQHQLTWNRLQRPNNPGGYTKRDVRSFKKMLGLKKSAHFIVSHYPQKDDKTLWMDFGGVKNHHLIYSAREGEFSIFTRINGKLAPLIYPAEPIGQWLDDGHAALSDT